MSFRLPRWFDQDANAPLLETIRHALHTHGEDAALSQLYLRLASGRYLDQHGAVYGVTRFDGEHDDDYRRRIIALLRTPRATEDAIREAVTRALPGVSVNIYTPVAGGRGGNVYTLSGEWVLDSTITLGGEDTLFFGGTPWATFIVDVAGRDRDLVTARRIIERVRAAGYIPIVRQSAILTATLEVAASGFLQSGAFIGLDGSRTLDGAWSLDYLAGEAEAL